MNFFFNATKIPLISYILPLLQIPAIFNALIVLNIVFLSEFQFCFYAPFVLESYSKTIFHIVSFYIVGEDLVKFWFFYDFIVADGDGFLDKGIEVWTLGGIWWAYFEINHIVQVDIFTMGDKTSI